MNNPHNIKNSNSQRSRKHRALCNQLTALHERQHGKWLPML